MAAMAAPQRSEHLEHRIFRLVRLLAVVLVVSTTPVSAAALDGVTMPDSEDIRGVHLVLNGMGLRTYSFLRIHIYVAGLYLARPSSDATTVLQSHEPKELRFAFLRTVDAARARESWRDSFDRSCRAGCPVSQEQIQLFLTRIPGVHEGDTSRLIFADGTLEIFINNRFLGRIADPDFSALVLATFLGPRPVSEGLKQGLLGEMR
jgi:hypothetical protein